MYTPPNHAAIGRGEVEITSTWKHCDPILWVDLPKDEPYESPSLNEKLRKAKEWLASRSFPHWSVGRINHD